MPDFTDLRDELTPARNARQQADQALRAVRERLKRVRQRQTELARVFNGQDQQYAKEREDLAGQERQLEKELEGARAADANARAIEADLLAEFSRFTDPRTNLGRLHDGTPMLLMPVRLETRFKTVTADNAIQQQLWVRVYPDDCWIDTFHEQLTESELTDAQTYWVNVWKAGGIEDQRRGAWRSLVNANGSGRARWIVQHYQPVNVATPPTKARPQDVILTIRTETPLSAAEESATRTYWLAVWIADGAAADVAAARAALDAAVGAARGAEIVAGYVPDNLDDPLPIGVTKVQVTATVAFVVFAPAETRQHAWSQPPRVNGLPERFVFIGYHAADPPLVVLGAPVPASLVVGPDPSAPEDEQLQHDDQGNLVLPPELQWIADFDRAVDVGMAFRIPLTPAQTGAGFDRILVIGIRLGADAETAQHELENLLQHHANSRKGLALVPQGTPTNNTESMDSGLQRLDDPDESFDDAARPLFTPDADWLDKRDGQWLAEYLGVDSALFQHVHGANATDQGAGRAMNEALWPTTLGYWMESMMTPSFGRDAVDQTRAFFSRYVLGAGSVPAIRIGTQPYGITTATAFSRMGWFSRTDDGPFNALLVRPRPASTFLARLHSLLMAMYQDWSAIADARVSYLGRDGDPHALLLDIVGLHSGSVEWSQRYAENLETMFNRLNLLGLGGFIERIVVAFERAAALAKLQSLGGGDQPPPIADLVFSGRHNELRGGVVDDHPLSEGDAIRSYTPGGANYIQWLIDAANQSLDALYAQNGFTNDTPPAALLYLLLRHALQLGYHGTSVSLYERAGLYTPEMAIAARVDDPFLHIRGTSTKSESRYEPLYAISQPITGSTTTPVHKFIASSLATLASAAGLRDQLDALERLKNETTARLERVFADHIDCCSYRLDAWMLGLVNCQLALMRNLRDGQQDAPRQGVYLGAYAWLEDLRPENKQLTPVEIPDPAIAADFVGPDLPPLMRDSTNEGYVHAPSSNHAVAAAVLRNGFISDASEKNRQTMAVNLTSERVRTALALLEGIRGGQSLGDLLGYQFERGLHDRHTVAEVDKYIYKLRKAFPLRADHLKDTQTPEGVSIEAIEARNVIDGLALAEHIKATGNKTYPFGKTGLPPTKSQAESDAIDAEAERLLEAHDAVADLALAEGVYQAVVGNYDRVASTYDAYARGNFPPEPDIVRTPFKGIGLTHRVALHLEAGVSSAVSPVAGVAMTPRAQAEPSLNKWLAGILPPPNQVGCTVTFRDAAAGTMATREVTLDLLGFQPADLIAILQDGDQQAMSELDDRVVRHAVLNFGPRPDVVPTIQYMDRIAAPYSLFELLPLVRHVRRLVTRSRPLHATDASLVNEARSKQDGDGEVDKARLDLVRNALQTLRNDAAALASTLETPLADLGVHLGDILANVDTYVADVTALLSRGTRFAMAQAGWGFAYDFRQRTHVAILDQAAKLVTRWDDKLNEFTDRLNEEAALPGTATDVQRFIVLQKAERILSTTPTDPLPATPALFRTQLTTVLQPAFVAKRNQFDALKNSTRTLVSQLLTDTKALLPVTAFDKEEYSMTAHEDQMVRFTEDAVAVLSLVVRECDRRLLASQDQYVVHATAASAADRLHALEAAAKALLGDDFFVVPEFTLSAAQGDELDNAYQASTSGDIFSYLTTPLVAGADPIEEFPKDTWLYGVARVRDKMHAWEQTMMLAGSFGRPEPLLDPLQIPFAPGDKWMGLEIPPAQALDQDHLLYTAHFATPFAKNARQCGLLLDEWTETIPGPDVNTGIAFHHDRPNCEAPQTMLLVTPTAFRGEWQWHDVVDALNETLTLAKRRAVEPTQIDATPYAWFLPATLMAVQVRQLTIAAELALNNNVVAAML